MYVFTLIDRLGQDFQLFLRIMMQYNKIMTQTKSLSAPETVYIEENTVFCDGGIGALGHPRVYLTINKETHLVDCPYCDKRFIVKEKGKK